jgi:hypothetical protein
VKVISEERIPAGSNSMACFWPWKTSSAIVSAPAGDRDGRRWAVRSGEDLPINEFPSPGTMMVKAPVRVLNYPLLNS